MLGMRALHDDAAAFSHTRTPAKSLLKHRTGALRENAVYHGSMTVRGKGKSMLHTPHHQSRKLPQTASKAKSGNPYTLVTRPLGDKTPAPNRQLPPSQQLRTPKPQAAKLLLNVNEDELPSTPECLLLPSAMRGRKSLKLPSRSLKTPRTGGNHLDVSDTELSMEMESGEGEVNIGEVGVHGPQEEDDEIEYMPPKLPEQPWAPPFDMPDYKVLGRAVVSIAHGARRDDTLDAYYAADNTFTANHLYSTSEDISLNLKPVDDDDPFDVASRPTPISAVTQARASSSSRPASQNSGRTATPPVSRPLSRTRSAMQNVTGPGIAPSGTKLASKVVPAAAVRLTRAASARAIPSGSRNTAPTPAVNSTRVQPTRLATSRTTATRAAVATTAKSDFGATGGRAPAKFAATTAAVGQRNVVGKRTTTTPQGANAPRQHIRDEITDLVLTIEQDTEDEFLFEV